MKVHYYLREIETFSAFSWFLLIHKASPHLPRVQYPSNYSATHKGSVKRYGQFNGNSTVSSCTFQIDFPVQTVTCRSRSFWFLIKTPRVPFTGIESLKLQKKKVCAIVPGTLLFMIPAEAL